MHGGCGTRLERVGLLLPGRWTGCMRARKVQNAASSPAASTTAMQSTISRLALFQFVTVVYSVLGIGVLLKMFYGDLPVPMIFARHLRDYGFLLMILPAIWLLWASVSAHRPKAGTGDFAEIFWSGIALLSLLIVLAIVGTMSAVINTSHIVMVKEPDRAPATRSR